MYIKIFIPLVSNLKINNNCNNCIMWYLNTHAPDNKPDRKLMYTQETKKSSNWKQITFWKCVVFCYGDLIGWQWYGFIRKTLPRCKKGLFHYTSKLQLFLKIKKARTSLYLNYFKHYVLILFICSTIHLLYPIVLVSKDNMVIFSIAW